MRIFLICLLALIVGCSDEQASEEPSSEHFLSDHFLSEQEEALKKAKEAARELENAGQKTKKIIDDAIEEASNSD